jgi:hypothetical protein
LKELKPFQVLLYVLGVLIALAPLVYFAPKDGWNLWGMNLRFMTQEEFFHPVKPEKADISNIVDGIDTTNIDLLEDPLLQHQNGSKGDMGAPSGGELSIESSTTIHLSDAGIENLHQFFSKMDKASNEKKKVHILHYGDSQIEGDRMTAYIRQRIQNQFGGSGPGLIPANNVYNTMTFKQSFLKISFATRVLEVTN